MATLAGHILTIAVFLPLLGALLLLAFPRGPDGGHRGFALLVSALEIMVVAWCTLHFDAASMGMQFTEHAHWIPSFGISYALGIDGLSLSLILLTVVMTPLVILSTYSGVQDQIREYLVALLVLETAVIGTLAAMDLFLFYVFWELMLIPMYFLIGMWGGKERVYAALKFFIYTMSGSVLMLVGILYVYFTAAPEGRPTFEMAALLDNLQQHPLALGAQHWVFLSFAVAFAIKVPIVPFHTWLPDAHTEAPTGGSVILAAVLLKMGVYGLMRLAIPFFPDAAFDFLPLLGLLGVIGIVYGALVAMAQKDLKRLIAYTSVSHLGFVVLGLSAMTVESVTGSMYQMLNHGVSTGALFFLVGSLYERRHTRELDQFGGLAKIMPLYAVCFVIIGLSSIALPGLNGFVGEFLILIGSFDSQVSSTAATVGGVAWWGIALIAVTVLLIATAFLWWVARLYRRDDIGTGTAVAALVFTGAVVWLLLVGVPFLDHGALIGPLYGRTVDSAPHPHLFAIYATIATIGVVLAAVYMLGVVQKVFFGPVTREANRTLSDLSPREAGVHLTLVILVVLMGVMPQPFLSLLEPSAAKVTTYLAHPAAADTGPVVLAPADDRAQGGQP